MSPMKVVCMFCHVFYSVQSNIEHFMTKLSLMTVILVGRCSAMFLSNKIESDRK